MTVVHDTKNQSRQRTGARVLLHPVIVCVVTAIYAQVAIWLLVFSLLSNAGVFIGVAIAVPVLYAALLGAITRASTGRFHWWWNIVVATTLVVFAVSVAFNTDATSGFGGVQLLPLIVGLAAGLASLVVLPRLGRMLGIVALAAQIVVIALPLVSAQLDLGRQQSAEDAAESARLNDLNTRPYVIPGFTVQMVSPSDYETVVTLSHDTNAPTREGFKKGQSDLTLATAPIVDGRSLESEACRSILNPDAGGSVSNSCDPLDANTWLLQSTDAVSVVRIQGDSRIEIKDVRSDEAELIALVDQAQLMSTEQFTDWNQWLFDRNKKI